MFKETIKKIGEFFSGLWEGISDTFKSVGDWFTEKFTSARDGIKNAFSSVGNFFSGVWNGIKDAFGNIAGWFKDKFSAAWQAVKNVFSSGGKVFDGIKDGILNGLKTVINALISGINKIITIPFDGINWALDNLRSISIAGFEPFTWLPTINTPQIPYLAQGGFVKANTPQLAVIGDNRHQGEVVAPEGKLQEMVDNALRAAGSNGISKDELESILDRMTMRILSALAGMGFFVDGEELATAVIKAINRLDGRMNPVKIY